MQSFHSDSKQFFFNKEQLHQFVSAPDSKRKNIPGAAYFKKLNIFMTEHVHVG